jgi:hypothetical protein
VGVDTFGERFEEEVVFNEAAVVVVLAYVGLSPSAARMYALRRGARDVVVTLGVRLTAGTFLFVAGIPC